MKCPCCSSSNFVFWFRKNKCDLHRCRECGLVMVWPVPSIDAIYGKAYFQGAPEGFGYVDYDQDKQSMDATFEAFLDRLDESGGGKGLLVDVGAATGYFLNLARKRGWQVRGSELSAWAAAEAGKKKIDVFAGRLEDMGLPDSFVDAMTFIDVFEHLPDPVTTLAAARRALRPGGLVMINTPDTSSLMARVLGRSWHLLTPPEHLVFFNSSNLSRLLDQAGFEVLRKERIAKKFALQYVLRFVGVPQSWLAGGWLGKLSLPLDLRDNMFLLARKK